jgi:hypothetical protein
VAVHRDTFLIIKPTRCTNFSKSFSNETLHVSDSSSVHHQEFCTVHTAMVYVIHVCWQLASRIMIFHPDPARKLSTNLYDIYHCCLNSEKTPDDGQSNCPKHVEFHSKNKFEKLVHLVCFIIRNLSRCTDTWTLKGTLSPQPSRQRDCEQQHPGWCPAHVTADCKLSASMALYEGSLSIQQLKFTVKWLSFLCLGRKKIGNNSVWS